MCKNTAQYNCIYTRGYVPPPISLPVHVWEVIHAQCYLSKSAMVRLSVHTVHHFKPLFKLHCIDKRQVEPYNTREPQVARLDARGPDSCLRK